MEHIPPLSVTGGDFLNEVTPINHLFSQNPNDENYIGDRPLEMWRAEAKSEMDRYQDGNFKIFAREHSFARIFCACIESSLPKEGRRHDWFSPGKYSRLIYSLWGTLCQREDIYDAKLPLEFSTPKKMIATVTKVFPARSRIRNLLERIGDLGKIVDLSGAHNGSNDLSKIYIFIFNSAFLDQCGGDLAAHLSRLNMTRDAAGFTREMREFTECIRSSILGYKNLVERKFLRISEYLFSYLEFLQAQGRTLVITGTDPLYRWSPSDAPPDPKILPAYVHFYIIRSVMHEHALGRQEEIPTDWTQIEETGRSWFKNSSQNNSGRSSWSKRYSAIGFAMISVLLIFSSLVSLASTFFPSIAIRLESQVFGRNINRENQVDTSSAQKDSLAIFTVLIILGLFFAYLSNRSYEGIVVELEKVLAVIRKPDEKTALSRA